MNKDFKKIFTSNNDINKTAYMNWRMDNYDIENMIIMAEGYIDSAIIIIDDIVNSGNKFKKADNLIFPILFNANHGIELYLKATIWALNILLDDNHKIEGKHNIKQIFENLKSKVNIFEKENKQKRVEFKKMTKNLERYLKEIEEKVDINVDGKYRDNMDFPRYPFNVAYINHFYVGSYENISVDLENLRERLKEIKYSLANISKSYFYDSLVIAEKNL